MFKPLLATTGGSYATSIHEIYKGAKCFYLRKAAWIYKMGEDLPEH